MIPAALLGAGAVASTADDIYNLIIASKQRKLAEKLSKTPRPTYNIPNEILQSEDLARTAYQDQTLPGQSAAEDKLEASTANTVKLAGQSGRGADILSVLSAVDANEKAGKINLATQAANMQNQDRQNLQNNLENKAQYQDKAFDMNEFQPYENNMKASSALFNAAGLNSANAVKGIVGSATDFLGDMAGNMMEDAAADQTAYKDYVTGGGTDDFKTFKINRKRADKGLGPLNIPYTSTDIDLNQLPPR
jgi:hypothetical protein